MERLTYRVTSAVDTDPTELADVAARTFPLACPTAAAPEDVEAFIRTQLSADRFADYLADPDRTVLVARAADHSPILGYTMLIHGVPADPDVQRSVTLRPAVELSKMYVLPEAHGGTVASALMTAALGAARELRAACVWLGVNQENIRAQRFYTKHGFTVTGTKTFALGARIEADFVMVRAMVRPSVDREDSS